MWWTSALIIVLGALALGFAWIMLRTMSMMKAGLALMLSSVGVAGLLVLLHADVLAAMTVMMFGPAMTGMIIFMLMLMEDSGGFMMTGSEEAPAESGPDVEPEVLAQADELLAPIDTIAPIVSGMDMEMTNAFMRPGALLALAFFAISVAVILLTPYAVSPAQPPQHQPLAIGSALLGKYMIAFEGAGLLILLAIAGATMLGRREPADEPA